MAQMGCATKLDQDITLPDGTAAKRIVCVDDLNVCYRSALQLCPHGYEVVDKREIVIASQSPSDWPRDWLDQGHLSHRPVIEHSFIITCSTQTKARKAPKAKLRKKPNPKK